MHNQQTYSVNPFEFDRIGSELKINFEPSEKSHVEDFSFYNIDDSPNKTGRVGIMNHLADPYNRG